ncbi:DUF4123 domain-containing protein [Janthinobacterium sp. 17J80-10]|uniref:DUF4123 domain-containing protein n=1 Tax=Janthinobacterium sp. 17J80-10 TaxID=2497863 RepID=UPI001005A467|nr:DUF4123 domain-containing protein [Janthinobacterium sp. 17J80-10]QAU34201.1 DUF4123 domain-containing protein [Janthinobacterium sp. 17J80-10]
MKSQSFLETRQPEGTVNEQAFCLLKEFGHCDLILDPMLGDPLEAERAVLAAQKKVFSINPKKTSLPANQCLQMARLTIEELHIFESSIDIGTEENCDPTRASRSTGGWIFSRNVSSERLVKHVELAVVVRNEKFSEALMRVWDPRVMGHLARILSQEQLAGLLGPIEVWAWIDRDGKLRQLKNFRKGEVGFTPATLPLRLSDEQDKAVDRIEVINLLLKALANLGRKIAPERDHVLDEILRSGQGKGHINTADLIAYGLHALLISKAFDAIPEVRQAIAQSKAKGQGLCSALEKFDDAFWDAHITSSLQ